MKDYLSPTNTEASSRWRRRRSRMLEKLPRRRAMTYAVVGTVAGVWVALEANFLVHVMKF